MTFATLCLCEGRHHYAPKGELRLLPVGREAHHGNMILCRACYEKEMRYRRERNRELAKSVLFALPRWETLNVYRP